MPERLSEEIIEKRTENSKTHLIGISADGKKRIFTYDAKIGAVHYKENYEDLKEQWKDIDTTIQEIDGKLVVNKAPYNLEIFKDRIGFKDLSKKGGWIETVMKGILVIPAPIIQANKVIFENVLPFVDVIIEAQPTRIVIWKKIKKDIPRQFKYEIKESKGKRNLVVLDRINSFDNERNEIQTKLSKKKISENVDYEVFERTEDVFSKAVEDDKEIKPVFPVMLDVIVDEQVGAGEDDCFRRYVTPYFSSSVSYFSAGYYDSGDYKRCSGMRLQTVAIPQGATIITAKCIFRCKFSVSGNGANTKIRGEYADNPPSFSSLSNWDARFPSQVTSAEVLWDDIESWTYNQEYDGPEIKTIIQEIVNRPGWASGNAMVLFWDDYDGRSSNFRYAYSYNGSSSYAPKLHIKYTEVVGAIMNQFQGANIGADLYDGALIC